MQSPVTVRSTQGHRITEWFGLEGTLKIIRFQPPCHEQGHLLLDAAREGPDGVRHPGANPPPTQTHTPPAPTTHPGGRAAPRLSPRPVPQYSSPTYTSMLRASLKMLTETIRNPAPAGRHSSCSTQGTLLPLPACRSATTASVLRGREVIEGIVRNVKL